MLAKHTFEKLLFHYIATKDQMRALEVLEKMVAEQDKTYLTKKPNFSVQNDNNEGFLLAALRQSMHRVAQALLMAQPENSALLFDSTRHGTTLHAAVSACYEDVVKYILESAIASNEDQPGYQFWLKDNHLGLIPLHEAVLEGKGRMVSLLLNMHQNTDDLLLHANYITKTGQSPLHLADASENYKCMGWLVSCGAYLTYKNAQEKFPLEKTCSSKKGIKFLKRSGVLNYRKIPPYIASACESFPLAMTASLSQTSRSHAVYDSFPQHPLLVGMSELESPFSANLFKQVAYLENLSQKLRAKGGALNQLPPTPVAIFKMLLTLPVSAALFFVYFFVIIYMGRLIKDSPPSGLPGMSPSSGSPFLESYDQTSGSDQTSISVIRPLYITFEVLWVIVGAIMLYKMHKELYGYSESTPLSTIELQDVTHELRENILDNISEQITDKVNYFKPDFVLINRISSNISFLEKCKPLNRKIEKIEVIATDIDILRKEVFQRRKLLKLGHVPTLFSQSAGQPIAPNSTVAMAIQPSGPITEAQAVAALAAPTLPAPPVISVYHLFDAKPRQGEDIEMQLANDNELSLSDENDFTELTPLLIKRQ